jgi:phosphoglycerate dehydrogenase-like enzyme
MTDASRPLVWLPFDASMLGEPPETLRYEVFAAEDGVAAPPSVAQVEFYVPPYRFSAVDGEVISQMRSLKVVQTTTAGVDHLLAFVPDGVLLYSGRGIHDASTAELTLTLMLASLRGVPDFVRAQDRGEWAPDRRLALADSTVLIVGYGAVGAAIERRLEGFETEVVRVARTARGDVHGIGELPHLLPQADVVVMILPITDETRGMVDADFLARMKDGALLVNVARGPVVDTDALVDALHAGRISAALDVTDPEPLPEGHPLWRAPNLLLSPHVGGNSSAMEPRAQRLVLEQLQRFASGEPMVNLVTGDY